MSIRGFPGKRLEAYLAGIIPKIGFIKRNLEYDGKATKSHADPE
jgi:hypothetical protein